jgi:hypothetical protein
MCNLSGFKMSPEEEKKKKKGRKKLFIILEGKSKIKHIEDDLLKVNCYLNG